MDNKQAVKSLHTDISRFELCVHNGKKLQARAYMLSIQNTCKMLGYSVHQLLGTEYKEYFVTEPSQSVTEASQSVTEPEKCLWCQAPLDDKKAGAKFCKPSCKTNYHRQKICIK